MILSHLPIKWKLTIGSTCMIFLCFAAYNTVQYFFVQNWIVKEQKENIHRDMNDILNYFLERESSFQSEELASIRNYLDKKNINGQLIRVLDDKNKIIVEVSDDLPEKAWNEPLAVNNVKDIERVRYAGGSVLVLRSPLTIFEFNGTVEIIRSVDEFDKLVGAIFRVMIGFGLGAIILSGIVGWLLAYQFLRPLKSMADTIRSIKRDGMQARMQPQGSQDELSVLMMLFNEMMDQVERSFEQQSRFVEDASHELRTPIAIIEGHLRLLKRWGTQDPSVMEESLAASTEELIRLKTLVEELLALTRAEQGNVITGPEEEIAVEKVVRSLVKKLLVVYPISKFNVKLGQGAEHLCIAMPESHLEQVLLILIDNAINYSDINDIVTIKLERIGDEAHIAVIDNGTGIPVADLPYVMDRFYRADKARSRTNRGHGLGLAIAKRMVENRGGIITIQSEEMRGTIVLIQLPLRVD